MSAWGAPSLRAWAREALGRLREKKLAAGDVVVAAMITYVVAMSIARFAMAAVPWANEGDWKQWIWEYHRYWTPGAFPPGHMITDYQFRVQPPLYFAAMASLSHVMHPGVAARVLSLIAYAFTVVPLYRVTTRYSHWSMGLCALVIYCHDYTIFHMTMGGYPRSFAPALVLVLLDAWTARRHALAIVALVMMGGIYPSVLPPCGLAYGLACAVDVKVGWRRWLLRCTTVVAAGAVAGALAMAQNALALPWWGPVISIEEAQQLPALFDGGRMKWLPLGNYFYGVWSYLSQPYDLSGGLRFYGVIPWPEEFPEIVALIFFVGCFVIAVRARARLPREVAALVAAACITFLAARVVAFRMYLPHRVLQHTLPYCTMIAFPVVAFHAARAVKASSTSAWAQRLRHRHDVAVALFLVFFPLFLLAGDGVIAPNWGVDDKRQPMMKFIRENTPMTAQFAGDLDDVDQIPYFAARPIYVNWTMAHPFRLGYWHEIERRLIMMHNALYADDPAALTRFIEDEHIDYFAVDPDNYTQLSDRKLFNPIGSFVRAIWQARKGHFLLAAPPASTVVYRDEHVVIIDAKKLVVALRTMPPPTPPTSPPTPTPTPTTPTPPTMPTTMPTTTPTTTPTPTPTMMPPPPSMRDAGSRPTDGTASMPPPTPPPSTSP